MSEYKLDILGQINLSDYSKIHDYMGIVDVNDRFTITLSNESIENSDVIYNMLKSNNFNINHEGGSKDGRLWINATRNKW